MIINFFNEGKLPTEEYEELISKVFAPIKNDKVFSIVFVDDAKIHEINRTYRNVDRVTDVISFALCDDAENELDDELGDIFIDLEQAFRQASEYGHSVSREVAFLAVHGYLHLCGYDHMTKEDEEIMCQKQEEILEAAGLKR
ncbi:MAG: rRNA maturation RNase YbeY [Anaeroplasmataceae bacterium]|nr:rRNA maturation RNase YbeY [Anaeroplasmataceae bacterium]MDE6414375.1 rRNA maturation RNase YbeY [Anaeroplasmataceae bacterium]